MRTLLAGAGAAFVARLAGAGAQFLFYVLLAQRHQAQGMGAFVLAVSVATVVSTAARWGVDQIALRELSVHVQRGEADAFRCTLRRAIGLVALFGAAATGLLWTIAEPLATRAFGDPGMSGLLRILAVTVLPFALTQLLGEVLRAAGRHLLSALVHGALVPCIALGLLAATPAGDGPGGAAAAYAAAVAMAAIAAWLLIAALPVEGTARAGALGVAELLAAAGPVGWTVLLSVWLGFCETLLLGSLRDAAEAGVYAAALRLALLLNFLLVAFNTVLAPRFAVLYKDGQRARLRRLAVSSTLAMLVLSAPFFVGVFVFPGELLSLFGPQFAAGADALRVLGAGQFVNLCCGPVMLILLMTGHQREARRHTLVTVAVNLAAALWLIERHGVPGAAWSAALGMVLLNLLALSSVLRVLREPAPGPGPAAGAA